MSLYTNFITDLTDVYKILHCFDLALSEYTKFTMVLREQYANFTCDLKQIYKSNLCFDSKKILKISEIE